MNPEHLLDISHQEEHRPHKTPEGIPSVVEDVTTAADTIISGCSDQIQRCEKSSKLRASEFKEKYEQLESDVLQGIRIATLALTALTQVGCEPSDNIQIKKTQSTRTVFDNLYSAKQFLEKTVDTHKKEIVGMNDKNLTTRREVYGENIDRLNVLTSFIEDKIVYYQNILDELNSTSGDKVTQTIQELKTTHDQSHESADIGRQWIADVVHSPAYQEKLLQEGATAGEGEYRKKRSIQDIISFGPLDGFNGVYLPPLNTGELKEEMLSQDRDLLIDAEPRSISDQITIDAADLSRPERIEQTSVHETHHYVTRGSSGITEYAKNLYKEALDLTYLKLRDNPFSLDYMQRPEELDAHKKEFEFQFEKLTDWEYGQPFNTQHVKKARQLLNEGKFTSHVQNFLNVVKPEYIEVIMNTLADVKSQEDQSIRKTA